MVLWRIQQGGNQTFMWQLVASAEGVLEPCDPRTELPSCCDTPTAKAGGSLGPPHAREQGGDLLSHSLRPCCRSLIFSTEISASLTYMPTKYLGSGEWEPYGDLVVLGCSHYIYIQQHRESSLSIPAFPSPAQTLFHGCPGFFHPIFFLWPYFFFPPPFFSLVCHTHTESHTQSSQSLGPASRSRVQWG